MANWLELAERCEGAALPDLGLDQAVHAAVHGRADPLAAGYTASLDAIVALIEERLPGRSWGTGKPGRRGKAARGTIAKAPGERGVNTHHHGNAATPALALCAAFCRAMAEGEKSGG